MVLGIRWRVQLFTVSALVLTALVAAGCESPKDSGADSEQAAQAQPAAPPKSESALAGLVGEPVAGQTVYRLEEGSGVVLDPTVCEAGEKKGFYWGMGSGSLEALDNEKGKCRLVISSELEGGYTTLRCAVPRDFGPVILRERNQSVTHNVPDARCEAIEQGNAFDHIDKMERMSN